jgi:hypothetical protein
LFGPPVRSQTFSELPLALLAPAWKYRFTSFRSSTRLSKMNEFIFDSTSLRQVFFSAPNKKEVPQEPLFYLL